MDCPEAMERGRNFRLLAEDELSQLLEFLARYLPESLKFHQTLLTYMRDRVWEFHFYVANDWPEDAICIHFPGMTLSPHGLLYESVGVFCPNDRLELLRLVREEDILIDWSKPLYINFAHSAIAEELVKLYGDTGTVDTFYCDVWACEDPDAAKESEDEDAEADVQVLPLKGEHAEGIHELYPANDMECHELFLRLIRTLPAAGVFAKGRLAAWMIQSYYGAMFSMQTKPEYRRKGYGTKLARYLTRRVVERGYYPFVVIRPDNEASQSLYTKLGFRKLYQTVRMCFMPSTWQDNENENSGILRDNLENAVRQLAIEQRVISALRDEDNVDSIDVQDADGEELLEAEDIEAVVQEPEEQEDEEEGPGPTEDSEERTEVTEEPVEENPEEEAAEPEEVEVVEETEAGEPDGADGGD